MSIPPKLSATALITLVAMSAMAMSSASAFPSLYPKPVHAGSEFPVGPVSTTSRFCEGAVSRSACGDHLEYLQTLRSRRLADTSPAYMKTLDPRSNQALLNAGGGGGGGG